VDFGVGAHGRNLHLRICFDYGIDRRDGNRR
jgi:hypothetical protein